MYDSFTMINLTVGVFVLSLIAILLIAARLDRRTVRSIRIAGRPIVSPNASPSEGD